MNAYFRQGGKVYHYLFNLPYVCLSNNGRSRFEVLNANTNKLEVINLDQCTLISQAVAEIKASVSAFLENHLKEHHWKIDVLILSKLIEMYSTDIINEVASKELGFPISPLLAVGWLANPEKSKLNYKKDTKGISTPVNPKGHNVDWNIQEAFAIEYSPEISFKQTFRDENERTLTEQDNIKLQTHQQNLKRLESPLREQAQLAALEKMGKDKSALITTSLVQDEPTTLTAQERKWWQKFFEFFAKLKARICTCLCPRKNSKEITEEIPSAHP